MMLRLLNIVAAIRRRVPYGILKNWTCSVESAIEHRLGKKRFRVTITDLIQGSGAWWGGKRPLTFSTKDFVRFMERWGITYPRTK